MASDEGAACNPRLSRCEADYATPVVTVAATTVVEKKEEPSLFDRAVKFGASYFTSEDKPTAPDVSARPLSNEALRYAESSPGAARGSN